MSGKGGWAALLSTHYANVHRDAAVLHGEKLDR